MQDKKRLGQLKTFNDLSENLVPVAVLKAALGISLKAKSKARSFDTAEEFYRREAGFSELGFAHVDAMIKYATTFNQAMRAHEETLPGSKQRRNAFVKALSLINDVRDIEPVQQIINDEDITLLEKTELINALAQLEGVVVTLLLERPHDTEVLLEYYEILSLNSPGRLRIVKAFCGIAYLWEMNNLLEDIISASRQNVNEIGVLVESMLRLQEEQKDLLAKSIEDIEMPAEVFNLLKSGKINTLGELLEFSEDGLNKYRKLSKKKIKVIVDWLRTMRLELPQVNVVQL